MIQLAAAPSRSSALIPKAAPPSSSDQRPQSKDPVRQGRILGIVQARMSSTRFPGKMLAPLAGFGRPAYA